MDRLYMYYHSGPPCVVVQVTYDRDPCFFTLLYDLREVVPLLIYFSVCGYNTLRHSVYSSYSIDRENRLFVVFFFRFTS